jgi:hypothetical protein
VGESKLKKELFELLKKQGAGNIEKQVETEKTEKKPEGGENKQGKSR